ncbi:MAG: GGDEF domain-containing protein [Phycisphaeraceae bacterium JB051]
MKPKRRQSKHASRRTLARRLMIWAVVLIAVPMFACAILLTRLTGNALKQSHANNVQMLGQTLAASLVARGDMPLAQASSQLLDVLDSDKRLAFVAVMDGQHQLLHRRTADPQAWSEYEHWTQNLLSKGSVDLNQPHYAGEHGEVVVYKQPIWNPPFLSDDLSSRHVADRKVEGYILLAMRDRGLALVLANLMTTQLTVTSLMMLGAILMAIWGVKRWMSPVKALLAATERLGEDDDPPVLPVHRHDEIGLLTESFNRMARRLFSTRRRLLHANDELYKNNQQLEAQVAQRTEELTATNRELQRAVDQLQTMAATDPLTGLCNRRAFDQAMDRAFAEARRFQTDLACVMIDLDGFKQLNDQMGHPAGDQLLVGCAQILSEMGRTSDVVGRFGGDEFVMLLPGTAKDQALIAAQRVQQAFAEYVQQTACTREMSGSVTMSMGVACLRHTQATEPLHLLACADQALYHAKSQGKNCVSVYHGAIDDDQSANRAA